MNIFNNYIPREYLALKINYCRLQLEKLPVVKVYSCNSGERSNKRIIVDNHKYDPRYEPGKQYYALWQKRDRLEKELRIYQAIWDANFQGVPCPDCKPHSANRVICVDTNKPVILNREYFDSLKNDANTSYSKPENNMFNGIKYRSAAEKEIAIFYTEMGIPFKYEPEIHIKGLVKPVYPDFLTYIEELDNCKFHEHFGMKDYADYIKDSKIKFSNFINAGLVQDVDVLFTQSMNDAHFDPRHLSAKLNAAIYGTICFNNPL